jgi:hypothetical protein
VKDYERVTCPTCGGHGVVSDYGPSGEDFYGPKECPTCLGGGGLVKYRSSPVAVNRDGRLVRYTLATHPGGPFRGGYTSTDEESEK